MHIHDLRIFAKSHKDNTHNSGYPGGGGGGLDHQKGREPCLILSQEDPLAKG